MTVPNQLQEMVAAVYGVDIQEIKPDTRFVEDLDDSMETVELTLACEEKFGIQIRDEEVYDLRTVGEFTAFIEAKLR